MLTISIQEFNRVWFLDHDEVYKNKNSLRGFIVYENEENIVLKLLKK